MVWAAPFCTGPTNLQPFVDDNADKKVEPADIKPEMVQVRQLKGQSRDFFDPCFLLKTLSGLLMNRLTQFRELFIFAKVPVPIQLQVQNSCVH